MNRLSLKGLRHEPKSLFCLSKYKNLGRERKKMAEYNQKKITKEDMILEYLKEGHELTCREAIDKFNVNYLPHYIHLLTAQGYNIEGITQVNPRTKKSYFRYKLVDEEVNDTLNGILRAKKFKKIGKENEARLEATRVIALIQKEYC